MGETVVTTTTDLSDPTVYDDLPSVGVDYEVAINGVGYMLFDGRETFPDFRYRRGIVPLEPERFATGDTPFAEAIERYFFSPFADFSHGAGQNFLDRPVSDPNMYFDSLGVDPFTVAGELSLLDGTTESMSCSSTTTLAEIAGDYEYVWSAADTVKYRSTLDDGGTSFGSFTTVTDICSDGQYCYVADSTHIWQGTTSGTSWGTLIPTYISYAGQRICAAIKGATSSTPNEWATLGEDGVSETTPNRLVLDDGWTVGRAVGGSGFVWFPAFTGPIALIYRWQPGSDTDPAIVYEMPAGVRLTARSLFFYQGQLLIRAYEEVAGTSTKKALIYRCPIDADGVPQPILVLELYESGVDHSAGGWGADGKYVYFGWNKMNGTYAGVGCIDLTTGGYAKWFLGDAAGAVRSIHEWKGYLHFTIDGDSVQRATPTAKVSEGYLITPVSDKNSTLSKVWDQIRVLCEPLAAGQSIEVWGSIDHFVTWEEVSDAGVSQLGGIGIDATWDKRAQGAALKVILNRGTDASAGPTLRLLQVRGHPLGLADQVVILPINCADFLKDLRGRPLPENAVGAGAARARVLENLAQARVKFQDVDWADTQTSYIMECEEATTERLAARDPSTNKIRNLMVVNLSLRRRLK